MPFNNRLRKADILRCAPLRFYKGFTNLRERTSRSRHFYLARRAQIRTYEPHINVKWTQMLSSLGYWEPLQPFKDLKVYQNITIQIS